MSDGVIQQLTLNGEEAERRPITSERVTVALANIRVDPAIYPREEVDHKRIERYAACMRDGNEFPLAEIALHPEDAGKYRVLDGAHRIGAYKAIGREELEVLLVDLGDYDALLYSASRNRGPKELREKEARDVARRAYERNPDLSSWEIGAAIARSRQAVDEYIADLRAAVELATDLAILRMDRLDIPQERIGVRVGFDQPAVAKHLFQMPQMANGINANLARGFPVGQVAAKQGWPEPLVWSLALEGKSDAERFEALQWGIHTWDDWYWSDVDKRFGDDWPGRIPAQLVAHALYFFTKPGALVFDPMAGGGVVADTCLALGRHCWSFDLDDRPETRPEIEPHLWTPGALTWPVESKAKPDLIFFDPPYFDKKADAYAAGSISALPRQEYLEFFAEFFSLARAESKRSTRLAFLNADWRDFQGKAALDEDPRANITMKDYERILERGGWQVTHNIDARLSTERFSGAIVKQMQASRILGVVRRTLLMARRSDS